MRPSENISPDSNTFFKKKFMYNIDALRGFSPENHKSLNTRKKKEKKKIDLDFGESYCIFFPF